MTDLELTTHVRCREEELPTLLTRFARMLLGLGFTGADLDKQFAQVQWEPDGSGFGYLCESAVCTSTIVGGRPLTAQPYILGYIDSKEVEAPWVQLSLVFDGEMIEAVNYSVDGPTAMKLNGAGAAIWRLARAYSAEFPDSGVFFSDSPSVNQPWEALKGVGGNLWWFDLALIPPQLTGRFLPIRDGYAHIQLDEAMVLAPFAAWEKLPWLEVSS